MPVILPIDAFRWLFYANEGDPREPPHVHVRLGGNEAKFWISPEVILAYNRGLNGRLLNCGREIVDAHREQSARGWHDDFS